MEEPLTRLNALGDDVTDARTTEIVGHGALPATRLVHREVDEVLLHDDADAVDTNHCVLGVDTQTLFDHDAAVDLDATLIDQFFSSAA